MSHFEIAAFTGKGLCLPCIGIRGTQEDKAGVLDGLAKKWNATYVLSEDGRYAKFEKLVEP